MKSSPRTIALIVTALLAVVVTVPASAQIISAPVDTLSELGRSSYEEGYLSLFDMNRVPVGARMIGMGGAGLALLGGPEYMGLNPVSILGVEQIQLEAEAILESGGGSVSEYPELIPIAEELFLNTNSYQVSPRSLLDYRSLSLGSPLVIFGGRGAVALSYRRHSRAGQSVETRAVIQSNAFQSNEPVTFGRGDNPDGGLDAISVAIARELNSWLEFGAALNFESGTISRDDESGISTYGFTILNGYDNFDQDVSAFNVDLGGRANLGRLKLAGTAYLAHDMKFKNGQAKFQPLPGNTVAQRYLVNLEIPDHNISVPTIIGVGGAFDLSDRLTLAADYWIRPWSDAEITRRALDPVVGFTDIEDSTSFYTAMVAAPGEETFSAGLEDDNSFRMGLEYMAVEKPHMSVPIRFGFRKEKRTISNVRIPDAYEAYNALVATYYQQLVAGEVDPEVEATLLDFVEHSELVMRGDMVDANVFSFGVGVNIDAFTIDVAMERSSYDQTNFYLSPVDPDLRFNSLPLVETTNETRSITNFSITTRWRF